MKEFFLGAVLARDELNIVHHQNIDRAEQFLEPHRVTFPQRLDKAIHELFCRQINHTCLGLAGAQFLGNGVHQVGLTQANAAIKEQRVKRHRTALGHAARGGMGQFVRLADHERVERKTGIDRGTDGRVLIHSRRRGRRGRCRRCRRGRGDARAGLTDGKFQTVYMCAVSGKDVFDLVAEIARDPIPQKRSGCGKACNAAVQLAQRQRLDPSLKVILADGFLNFVAYQSPSLIRHSFFAPAAVPSSYA